MRPRRQRLRTKAGCDIGGQLLVPAPGKSGLERAGLDGLDAGDALDEHGLALGPTYEFFVQPAAQDRHHQQAQARVQRQAGQHDQGQGYAVNKHDRDEHDREEHVQHHGQCLACEEAADIFQFMHARDRIAHAPRLEIRQRQLHQMAKQPGAEFDIDAAGGVAKDVGAQTRQHAFEDDHHQQTGDEHVQSRQALVDQHLVHHALKEQGTDQGEQLQKEADDKHLCEQRAVLDEAGDEPAKVKVRAGPGQAGSGSQNHQFAIPLRGELVAGDTGRRRVGGAQVLHQHLLAVAACHDDPSSVPL